jgi:hypothetical protein
MAPPGTVVTASTVAPGFGPPTGALADSAGSADHNRRVLSGEPPIRITGWFTPSEVTDTAL